MPKWMRCPVSRDPAALIAHVGCGDLDAMVGCETCDTIRALIRRTVGGTQPPSGLREDPVAPVTVNAPHATKSSALSAAASRPPSAEPEIRAEALWEELGGDLCVCQNVDVPHWCESCQRKLQTIREAFKRLARAPLAPPACNWSIDDNGGDSVYETGCGHAFEFNEAGPEENGFAFCGYCGKSLHVARTSAEGSPLASPAEEQ